MSEHDPQIVPQSSGFDSPQIAQPKAETAAGAPKLKLAELEAPRNLKAATAIAIVLSIAAGVVAGLAVSDAKDANRKLSRLEARVASIASDVSSTQSDVSSIQSDLSSVTSRVDSITGAYGDLAQLADRIDTTDSDLNDIKSCVNDYMDTVAQSGGGGYNYFYCR